MDLRPEFLDRGDALFRRPAQPVFKIRLGGRGVVQQPASDDLLDHRAGSMDRYHTRTSACFHAGTFAILPIRGL